MDYFVKRFGHKNMHLTSFFETSFIPPKSNLILDKQENGDFERIILFYGINLKSIFPEIISFTTGQKAYFDRKGISSK